MRANAVEAFLIGGARPPPTSWITPERIEALLAEGRISAERAELVLRQIGAIS